MFTLYRSTPLNVAVTEFNVAVAFAPTCLRNMCPQVHGYRATVLAACAVGAVMQLFRLVLCSAG